MGYERHLGGTKCKHCRAVMADPLCICGAVHGYELCEPTEGHVCEVPEDGIDLRPHLRSIGATYAVVGDGTGDAHRVELVDDEPDRPAPHQEARQICSVVRAASSSQACTSLTR